MAAPPMPMAMPPIPMAMPPGFPSMPFPFPMAKATKYPKKPKRPPPTEPNNTLYVHNLPERRSMKIMKRELALLFQKYGQLLDVSIKRNLKMRGQAFVVFKDMEAAEKALNALQGQFFFNKPMDIQYARYKSDAVAREDGTLEQNKEARAERKANAPPSDEEEEDDKEGSDEEGQDGEEGERPAKRAKKEEEVAPAAPPAYKPLPPAFQYPEEPPHNILFVQNIPAETADDSLKELFSQYPGYKEVRYVPRNRVAFVEYETEGQAIIAKMALHGFSMSSDGQQITVTYAKK